MTEKKQYPAEEGLFTWPADEPCLIGGRCKSCGTYFFPKYYVIHKPGCKERQVEGVLLSRRGKLDSYTIQCYPPPPPFYPNLHPSRKLPHQLHWGFPPPLLAS